MTDASQHAGIRPRSLVPATNIDVLPPDATVTRVEDHLVVRSPGHPGHWEGNLLIFDDAPRAGDGPRWEAAFAAAFGDEPDVRHRAFAWDRTDGEAGAAESELSARGFELDRNVGLVADPDEIVPHPRASRDVVIQALDPAPGAEAELWEGAIAVSMANYAADPVPTTEADFEAFLRARAAERRTLFAAGRGAWYVARDGAAGTVIGGCGIVVTAGRARYQAVDVAPDHRRRGVASRLVADAAAHAAAHHTIDELVIAADADYHALGIYRSLGFRERERVVTALRPPLAADAGL